MRFIILSELQAAELCTATAGMENRLVPRQIQAGDEAGKYVVSDRVLEDPAHAEFAAMLTALPVVEIDTEAAWPALPQDQ